MKLTTGRLVNGSSCGGSDMVIKDLDMEPKVDAMMRDFLDSIKYALMVNPTVYESCIQQFWATAKAKTVNEERRIQALVDKKKAIITEKSVRSDLMLDDAAGTECVPNDVIFEQLTLMGAKTTSWNEFSSTIASAIICVATNKKFNFSMYIFDYMMKNLEGRVKFLMYLRKRLLWENHNSISKYNGSSMGEDSAAPMDSHSTPIVTQLSSSKPQKKKSRRKQKKNSGPTEPIPDEATNEEPISTPSYDPPQSGKDILQLTELMTLCTKLQKQVFDLEEAKTAQAKEIASLEKRGRKIADLDADKEVTLIDETQERYGEEMLFDVQDDLQGEEVVAKKEVAENEVSAADLVTTTGEVVTTANTTKTVDELTLAQTLIEIKAAKPKAVIIAAITTTRPKAKGVVVQEPSEFKTTSSSSSQASKLPQAEDKGKGKMVDPEKPLKKKD
ncbi:hypothetical protein Tco_0144672 [Tanacetum coccineum]